MSGIAGIVRFDGGHVDKHTVAQMTSAMAYRGPDGISHWSSGQAALGQCMLHTTSESLEEIQPLVNEDESLILVMDGRVDNWEELRGLLRAEGAHLRTRSDPELVLRAYERWGEDCLEHIDGDFAIAIWDTRRRRLFCVRDRSGIKPFVYHWDGRSLVFGSDIHSVLAGPGVPRDMNQGVLAEYLAADCVSRDETLWQGVTRLVAGHSMTVDESGPRIEKYWHPEELPLIQYKTDEEYEEHYREVLFEAVRRHARSHRTVGFEVSGGLDSSSLFAVGHNLHHEGRLAAPNISGFTLQFAKGTDAYELDFAHAVGAHLGREIQEIPPTQWSPDYLRQQSVRFATPANLPNGTMHLGMMETLHCGGGRVLLNGGGGDQWLAFGDSDLAECLQYWDWKTLFRTLKNDRTDQGTIEATYRLVRHGLYPLLPLPLRKIVRLAVLRGIHGEKQGDTWLSLDLKRRFQEQKQRAAVKAPKQRSNLRIGLKERLMSLNGAFPAIALEMMERLASEAGIEYRSPFRSKTFVEFALGLPLTQLRRSECDRFIHRKAMVGLLPDVVRQRNNKAEFSVVSAPTVDALSQMTPPESGPASQWTDPSEFSAVQKDARRPTFDRKQASRDMLLQFDSCEAIQYGINSQTKDQAEEILK